MNAKKIAILVTLGTCILGLSAFAGKKNTVERSFKSVIHQTLVITLDKDGIPVSWVLSGIALSSHFGLGENSGQGTYDTSFNPVGTGVSTAANGDQTFWKSLPGGGPSFITGGTGRFAGATGIIYAVSMEIVFRPDPPAGKLIADMVLHTEGTITY